VLPILAGLVFALAMLIAFPWHVMLVATLAYVASLPYSARSWRRLRRKTAEKELRETPAEDRGGA